MKKLYVGKPSQEIKVFMWDFMLHETPIAVKIIYYKPNGRCVFRPAILQGNYIKYRFGKNELDQVGRWSFQGMLVTKKGIIYGLMHNEEINENENMVKSIYLDNNKSFNLDFNLLTRSLYKKGTISL